ncbi:DNA-directed RNA polymerase sigma-70 factor [Salinimicrobium marinum]|uniref:DNA-directed RNA polymerase sigma-70 factor n=1 Tax=Salinimicrobium marinum TaxID=680283 RepID=A0A918SJ69_9FLAO|nr:sigma-70 family RNA polymerase sigma factor [Salinimicrobium marinum]GHA47665.1 DNA-directed RNA polymerase sigma-70 factor [Salinimicrobium marinum]
MSSNDYHTLKDSELWMAFCDGERKALEEIYSRNINMLYSYGAKITSDTALVEDCIQEVFITLWEKRKRLRTTNSIKFYLFKSLKRRIYRKLKESKKLGFRYDFSDPFLATTFKNEPAGEEMDEQTVKKINDSLNKLTNRQKEIIYLRFYAKLDFQEIASVMELSVKATYKLQARAIQRLKDNFLFNFTFF